MNKEEVIKRLCNLVSQVGNQVFKNNLEHDCFCGESPAPAGSERVHPEVMAFITNAVLEKIKEAEK